MGGFIAILNVNGAPVDPGLLRALLDLPACGPDRQLWTDGQIGLAFTPLRSIAASDAPMLVRDRCIVVFDGRLDDRASLRAQLQPVSRRNLSASGDAELVAEAYERWGAACPSHLLGEFAFCVCDVQRRRVIVARDRFGVKPLFMARTAHGLVFSNVLRSIRRHPLVSDRLDDRAIGDLLLCGLPMDDTRTSFAEISRIAPAHVVVADSAVGEPRSQRYWSFEPGEPLPVRDPQEAVEQFAAALRVAVDDRTRGGRVGIFMSGGLDSSSVAATAAELAGPSAPALLRAYTCVYDTAAADEERYYSTLSAASLNIGIDHLPVDGYALFERWDRGLLPVEPTAEPMTAPTADLLERASHHSGYVLTGDGGDPLLLPSTLIAQIGRVPLRSLMWGAWRSIRTGALPPLGIRTGFRRMLRAAAGEPPSWLADSLLKEFDPEDRRREINARRSVDRGPRSAAINSVLDPWWPSTFEAYDPGATGQPVAVMYPFFDLRLVSLALRLPSFPFCVSKHVLRGAMIGRLPDVIRLRPKAPLGVAPEAFHGSWSVADAVRVLESAPGMDRYVDARKFATTVRDDSLFTTRAPGTLAAVSLAMWLRHSAVSTVVA